ncbi:MAG: tetratricopeptide repeat protein [Longimicrobiales bacterium]
MSFFRRLLGPKSGGSFRGRVPYALGQQVRELERQAEDAPLGTKGTLLNRAGDVCMRAGDHQKALDYFRQAIDIFLEDDQPEPARGVAKKIIRVHPDTVRTHCTLTWLDLATRQPGSARRSLREYVSAAEKQGQVDQASLQILEMSRVTSHKGFLEDAAEALSKLGFPGDAELVREWVIAGGAPESTQDSGALSRHCLLSAIAPKGAPGMKRSTA